MGARITHPRAIDPARRGWSVRAMRSLLLIISLAASLAHAQYVNTLTGRQFNNMYAANADFMMTQMINNSMFQTRMAAMAGAQQAAAKKPPVEKFQFPLSATDFKPSGARNVPEQLATNAANPEERAQLVELCRQIQLAIEAQPDVRKNNLATAVTVLLGTSIQVVSGRELGDAESDGLLRLVNDLIVPSFKKMSAQQRTAAYDAFLITGGLIAGLSENAKETNDPALAAQAKELAKNALAQFGFK